eukprot:PhF_6_TR27917/c0_g1_i2/m.41021
MSQPFSIVRQLTEDEEFDELRTRSTIFPEECVRDSDVVPDDDHAIVEEHIIISTTIQITEEEGVARSTNRRAELSNFICKSQPDAPETARRNVLNELDKTINQLSSPEFPTKFIDREVIERFTSEPLDPMLVSLEGKFFFDNPKFGYSIPIVQWLACLPALCHHMNIELQFADKIDNVAFQVVRVMKDMADTLRGVPFTYNKVSEERAQDLRQCLFNAIDSTTNVPADVLVEEMMAITLYTLNLNVKGYLQNPKPHIHGTNPSFFAIANYCMRLYRASVSQSEEVSEQLRKTIKLFLPMIARVDVFLSRLPLCRKTLYRGIKTAIDSHQYHRGTIVPWPALSSTTSTFKISERFGQTIFVSHVHNGGRIGFASYFPDEEEYLLPSYTYMQSLDVLSPTLLQLLSASNKILVTQTVGDDEFKRQLLEGNVNLLRERWQDLSKALLKLFDTFYNLYIPGHVATLPAPLPANHETQSFIDYVNHFVYQSSTPQNSIIFGPGGCGKSSALLAAYHDFLEAISHNEPSSCLPVFVSLPSLNPKSICDELDTALRVHLAPPDVGDAVIDDILSRNKVVLFLDSLDECNPSARNAFPLIDNTKFCKKCWVVLSSRTEFVLNTSIKNVLSSNVDTVIRYMQPFSKNDVNSFCVKKGMKEQDFVKLEELGLGPYDSLRLVPIAFRMGFDYVMSNQEKPITPPSIQELNLPIPRGTAAYLFQKSLSNSLVSRRTHTALDVVTAEKLMLGMYSVALFMLNKSTSSVKAKVALRIFAHHLDHKDLREIKDLLQDHVPMRVETLDDEQADFQFRHKMYMEFLAAMFFASPRYSSVALHATRYSPTPFSLREPSVLSFFNEIIVRQWELCEKICKKFLSVITRNRESFYTPSPPGGMLPATMSGSPSTTPSMSPTVVPARRRFETAEVITTKFLPDEVLASNAMSLLAFAQFPLHNIDLSNITIRSSLLNNAFFEGANLTDAYFDSCDLTNSNFNQATVQGVRFRACDFGGYSAPLQGHTDVVTTIAMSRGSDTAPVFLASASEDRTVKFWDLEKGICVSTLKVPEVVVGIVFTENDNSMLCLSWEKHRGGGDERCVGTIRIFNLGSKEWDSDVAIPTYSTCVNNIAYTTSLFDMGPSVVCGDDAYGAAHAWSLLSHSHQELQWSETCKLTERYTTASCVLAYDNMLVAGMSSSIRDKVKTPSGLVVWKTPGNHETFLFNHDVQCLALNPKKTLLVCGSHDPPTFNTLYLLDPHSHGVIRTLSNLHFGIISSVSFSPCGTRLVSCSTYEEAVRIWDPETGQQVNNYECHEFGITSAVAGAAEKSYDNSSMIYCGSYDHTIHRWKMTTAWNTPKLQGLGGLNCVHMSSGDKYVSTVSYSGTATVFNATTGEEVRCFYPENPERKFLSVYCVCITADLKYVFTGSITKNVCQFELESGLLVGSPLQGHTSRVERLSESKDNSVVLSLCVDMIIVWSQNPTDMPRKKRIINAPTGFKFTSLCLGLDLNGDSPLLYSVSKRHEIELIHANASEQHTPPIQIFRGHTKWIQSVCFDRKLQRVLSCSADGTARVWDRTSGAVLSCFDTPPSTKGLRTGLRCGVFIPTSNDSEEEVSIAVSSWDRTVYIWHFVDTHPLKRMIKGHTKGMNILAIAMSQKGDHLFSISYDGTIRKLNMSTGRVWLIGKTPGSIPFFDCSGDVLQVEGEEWMGFMFNKKK